MSQKPVTIIPSDLAASKAEFDRRLAHILPIAKTIHVDIMDGKFVKTKSLPVASLPDVRRFTNRSFEAHLMVKNPGRYVETLIEKGFTRIIVHAEALPRVSLLALANDIRARGGKPVLAINPTTTIASVRSIAAVFDGLLVMGVFPGKNGAPYVASTPRRVHSAVKALASSKKYVQVDGGMTPQTIAAAVAAGATRIVSGSYIGSAKDPARAMREMRLAMRQRKKR